MPVDKALAIMTESVGAAIDPTCLDALRQAIGALRATLAA